MASPQYSLDQPDAVGKDDTVAYQEVISACSASGVQGGGIGISRVGVIDHKR
jgi:hypothetical protein